MICCDVESGELVRGRDCCSVYGGRREKRKRNIIHLIFTSVLPRIVKV